MDAIFYRLKESKFEAACLVLAFFSRLKMLETHSAHSERCIVVDFRSSPAYIVGDADSHFPASSPHGARPHG